MIWNQAEIYCVTRYHKNTLCLSRFFNILSHILPHFHHGDPEKYFQMMKTHETVLVGF